MNIFYYTCTSNTQKESTKLTAKFQGMMAFEQNWPKWTFHPEKGSDILFLE